MPIRHTYTILQASLIEGAGMSSHRLTPHPQGLEAPRLRRELSQGHGEMVGPHSQHMAAGRQEMSVSFFRGPPKMMVVFLGPPEI